MATYTNDTRVIDLTIGQLKEALGLGQLPAAPTQAREKQPEKRYVYGLAGLAELFGCSTQTAGKLKRGGKLDRAITQVGRKIIVDADLALELAGRKTGGRKSKGNAWWEKHVDNAGYTAEEIKQANQNVSQ